MIAVGQRAATRRNRMQQNAVGVGASELAAVIRVKKFGPVTSDKRILNRLDAKRRLHRDRQAVGSRRIDDTSIIAAKQAKTLAIEGQAMSITPHLIRSLDPRGAQLMRIRQSLLFM
ncbi:hypothetical protein DSM21852_26810 [Methylocystis bryophila]|nr:hypothetical protein DSM21852_26810 [Methylocystis bryophila]